LTAYSAQRFLALASRRRDLGLMNLGAVVGYADQPHLTRECVRLAGETPAALVARL
jgi:AraC-like DNA-binding protein